MKSKKLYHCSYIFFCIAFLQGLVFSQTPTPTPENTVAETSRDEINSIHYGDLIDVDIIGSIKYDWRGTINPEGFLDGLDAIENPIYALCRGEEEIAADIEKAYGKFLREPKVVVKILDRSNRPLAIIYGAVKMPQRFQIKRSVLLNELIILAGGLTEKVSGEIQIFRPQNLRCQQKSVENSTTTVGSGEEREKFVAISQANGSNYINIRLSDLLAGKKEANPPILSGDIITILESAPIYIIGGVAQPKQISSREQITLLRAIDSAGGVSKNADQKKITIYRREAKETKIIEANLEKIKTNQAEDIILKAFDIIEVTQTGRDARKFPPVLQVDDSSGKNAANLPLTVID